MSAHVIMVHVSVVVHLRELSALDGKAWWLGTRENDIWDSLADAASDLQRNWFQRPDWTPTAKREPRYP